MPSTPLWTGFLRSFIRWLVIGVVLLWSLAALILVAARWIDPPTTAVHIQRRFQAWIHHTPYRERYKFVPLSQISRDLQHAVIAAEDAHFYQHHGFDWHEIQIAAEDDLEGDRTRASWRYTSTWSNGALVFMVQSRRVVITTQPQPGILAVNRRHGSLQFCRLP